MDGQSYFEPSEDVLSMHAYFFFFFHSQTSHLGAATQSYIQFLNSPTGAVHCKLFCSRSLKGWVLLREVGRALLSTLPTIFTASPCQENTWNMVARQIKYSTSKT